MRHVIAVLATAMALAACHKNQPVTDASLSPTVTLEVVNNINPPVQVTVFILPQYGGRQVLGTVSPGRKGSFTYSPTNATDRFVFMAQAASGRTLQSQAFSLINLQVASWDMSSNMVRFYEP